MDLANLSAISSNYLNDYAKTQSLVKKPEESFSAVLNAAMNMVEETNSLQNKAEEEEIRFALGESENTHDLLIAQTKASVALQYTVAVKDGLLEAYKEIMQMQI